MPGTHERDLNTAPDAVDDLVLLSKKYLNEDGIVRCLENRYNSDLIYTYIGPVLLSVNPFKKIPGLYTEKLMDEFLGRFQFEVAPHVFGTAEDAHRKLMGTGKNQCILISGESGAGKTEAAKRVMEYVSKVSKDSSDFEANNNRHSIKKLTRTVTEIKESLLKSNPVLEAFGNAKTLRNDNSSRFGKYMEIQMDYSGAPLGGKITNYLLEKPRVVHQQKGERNFHVFYLLLSGASGMRELRLGSDPSKFAYLCDPGSAQVKTIDDADWYDEMVEAMASVGITDSIKMELFKLVAAVLHLGNIEFTKGKSKGQDACKVSSDSRSQTALKDAASLLQVSTSELQQALVTRSRKTTIDNIASPLTEVDECNKSRDALAKALYARLFQRVVGQINKSIHTDVSELSLGVLDIYGFEIFESNSFEQLCINYCNEKLQQYFIQLTLQSEQEEYRAEGIPWKEVKYFNNKVVCDLIESKSLPGIIAFLNEQITLNRDNDLSFLSKMKKSFEGGGRGRADDPREHFAIPPSNKSTPSEFVVRHYAGDVTYSAAGMIDKNKDTLYWDILLLAGNKSKSQFVREMFPEGASKRNFKNPKTAGSQFILDMNELIANLELCEPHYIRCIKPNDKKRSNFFNVGRTLHQVQYLGLMENVRVRRAGYAYRREYNLFVRRYKMLATATWPNPPRSDDKRSTEAILQEVGISSDAWKFGKTKIFIAKPEDLFVLEKARKIAMERIVAVIQKAYRQWKLRLYFQKIRHLAVNLLHGNKRRNNSWVLYFLGDYIDAGSNEMIMNTVRTNGDKKIRFADFVDIHSLGRKRSTSRLALVLTARSFIMVKNMNSATPVIERHSFDLIESLSLSSFADNYMVLKLKPKMNPKNNKMQDVPSILIESVRKSEISTVFDEEYKANFGGNKAPLIFQDSISLVVMDKKKGLKGMFSKPKPVEQRLEFFEDSSAQGKHATLLPQDLNKKSPGYDPLLNRVAVASKLGSKAEMQLDGELPERVIMHTAIGKQGKKKRRNRRRQY